MRPSRLIAVAACLWAATLCMAGPPERVVSINLCTDQLALELAAPGQLLSVSRLAQDPASSARHAAARGLHANGSGAEEVYLLRPDLVLAGTFTAPATIAMLRDIGIPVEVFAPATALDEIPALMRRMGRLLGREAETAARVAAFEARLARLRDHAGPRPRAALYYVNGYTSGPRSLAGDILDAAGLDNVAAEAGLARGGTLPLERLVMLAPDVVIRGRDYPGRARAEDALDHPALAALGRQAASAELVSRDWICGSPSVLDAVAAMRDLRLSLEGRQ